MIAPEKEKILWILDLVAEQEENRFQTLFSTVYIVSKKQIVGAWREAAHFKQANEVGVLTVHVTNDVHGRRQLQ